MHCYVKRFKTLFTFVDNEIKRLKDLDDKLVTLAKGLDDKETRLNDEQEQNVIIVNKNKSVGNHNDEMQKKIETREKELELETIRLKGLDEELMERERKLAQDVIYTYEERERLRDLEETLSKAKDVHEEREMKIKSEETSVKKKKKNWK